MVELLGWPLLVAVNGPSSVRCTASRSWSFSDCLPVPVETDGRIGLPHDAIRCSAELTPACAASNWAMAPSIHVSPSSVVSLSHTVMVMG